MKKKVIITVSIAMMGLVGLAMAGGSYCFGAKSAAHRIDYMKGELVDVLDLTETQEVALDRMADSVLAEHGRMAVGRNALKSRFMGVLNRENVSSEDFILLYEEKKPEIDRLIQLVAENLAEFHGILTPEQRAMLIEEMEKRQSRCRFGAWPTSTLEPEGDGYEYPAR